MRMIRKVPAVDERVETGAVKFGDDWPGIFIRGDDCLKLILVLDVSTGNVFTDMFVDKLKDAIHDATGQRL